MYRIRNIGIVTATCTDSPHPPLLVIIIIIVIMVIIIIIVIIDTHRRPVLETLRAARRALHFVDCV